MIKKIRKRWRVVEKNGRILKNKAGTAVDGGGYINKEKARKQAAAINISQHKK